MGRNAMPRIAYRLDPKPSGGFHLGREGLEQEASAETFPSDSLFAALIFTLVQLEGADYAEHYVSSQWPQADQMVEPPFRLSSLFPCAGDLCLFPMPRPLHSPKGEGRPSTAKLFKHLKFVSPEVLHRLLAGDGMDDWLSEDNLGSQGALLQGGQVWISRRELSQLPTGWRKRDGEELKRTTLWKSEPVPRVTIDRITNSSQIYHVGRTSFAEGCGLWLLADVYSDTEKEWLEILLEHLADQGIGGERSSGYGTFSFTEITAPHLPSHDRAQRVMTLSRYNPTRSELEAGVLGEGASYELVDVGGWLSTPHGPPQRRRRVRMIEAGSILVTATTTITGQVVDVCPDYDQPGAPDHPVYRSGIALTVGVTGGD